MLIHKGKKNQQPKGNRLLINIAVMGSAGPIRLVVNEGEIVAAVIETALKAYAREGRLPALGFDSDDFLLYCPNAGSGALDSWETIGSVGQRNFVLCKRPAAEKMGEGEETPCSTPIVRRGSGTWKSWINKSRNFKVTAHLIKI